MTFDTIKVEEWEGLEGAMMRGAIRTFPTIEAAREAGLPYDWTDVVQYESPFSLTNHWLCAKVDGVGVPGETPRLTLFSFDKSKPRSAANRGPSMWHMSFYPTTPAMPALKTPPEQPTLRDRFAMAALTPLAPHFQTVESLARAAYRLAKCMVRERGRTEDEQPQ